MSLIPAEMRRAVETGMEEQRVSSRSLDRSTAIKRMSTGMLRDPLEADQFAMSITYYAAKNYHELIYTPSLEWRLKIMR